MRTPQPKACVIIDISSDISDTYHMFSKFLKPDVSGIYCAHTNSLRVSFEDLCITYSENKSQLIGYKDSKEHVLTFQTPITHNGLGYWTDVLNQLSGYDRVYCPRLGKSFVFDYSRNHAYCAQTSPVPYWCAEKLVTAFIKWYIDSRCQWSKASFETVYNLFNKQDPRVVHLEIEDELLHTCQNSIHHVTYFIGVDDWCVYTVKKQGKERLYIEKGEDYRITQWMENYQKCQST